MTESDPWRAPARHCAETGIPTAEHLNAAPRLALRPKDAAKALGIGERLLWSLTNSGEIPHVKVGRVILYPVDTLRDWLARHAKGGDRR